MTKVELYHDNFQNYKRYNIPKAQLILTDIPYNVGSNAYGSNPSWYKGGDRSQGESSKAGKQFFNTDSNFNIAEFMHFARTMLKKEPKEVNQAPAMIVFCAFEQIPMLQEYGKKYGFNNSFPLFFIKDSSPQALKANMRIVGAVECALVLYRDKLPKFRNGVLKDKQGKNIPGTGKMVLNWFEWKRDPEWIPKIHPNQKPYLNMKELIEIFTDKGDTVIDTCAGSGVILRAAGELKRQAFGFEVYKKFYNLAQEKMLSSMQLNLLV